MTINIIVALVLIEYTFPCMKSNIGNGHIGSKSQIWDKHHHVFWGFWVTKVVDFLLLILKGGSKVQILGQGGAIKQPPMDEMTSNFACRGVLWGTFEFWPS